MNYLDFTDLMTLDFFTDPVFEPDFNKTVFNSTSNGMVCHVNIHLTRYLPARLYNLCSGKPW